MNNTNDVGQLFLRWLGDHAAEHPNPGDFLHDAPTLDGEPITEAQLTKAVLRAEHLGMIKGGHASGTKMPFRIRLLPPGQECLEDFDGDMRRWKEAQRGGSTVTNYDNSVHVTARDNVTVLAHAADAVQNVTNESFDPDRLRDVGTAVQEIVDVLPAPIRADVTEAGKDLVVASGSGSLDRVKAAAQGLLNLLTASSASLVVVRFIIDALTGGLGGQ